MFKRKLKSILISGIVTLSFVIGLLSPLPVVAAEDEDVFDQEWHVTSFDDVNSEADDSDAENSDAEATQAPTKAPKDETSNTNLDDGTDTPLGELVAYWPFDGNYKEEKSGLDTQLGAKQLTYTDGVFGKAAVFNGKDTYLTVKSSILNLGNSRYDNNDKFTISAWINLGDSKNNYKFLLDKGISANWEKEDECYWTDPYQISFSNCEPMVELSNEFESTGEEPDYITKGKSTTSGKYVEGQEWFLLTVTYDGSRVKIYRDNELLTQSNYTDGITFNNDDLYIGVDGKLEYFFKGSVDDLRIYTKTLSYDEVNELYDNGVASNKELVEPTKKLVAYYAFDDNLKDSSTFKNDAEKVAVGGTTKYVVGKNGKAITMSKGNYILVPGGDQLNLETEFTVSFWLKLDTEGTYPILYRQNPSFTDDNDNDWTYQAYINSWNNAECTSMSMNTLVYNPSDWTPENGQGLQTQFDKADTKLKGTDWIHYTYTYKDGQIKFYLNGKLMNKSDKSDYINIANASGDLLIGYDGDTFINGAIDELKIYTKCLSATDAEKEAKRVDSISLGKEDKDNIASIGKGKTVSISTIKFIDGDTDKTSDIKASDKNVVYKSSSKQVFTVSSNGKLTGVRTGKAKLMVCYGPHVAVYSVEVK